MESAMTSSADSTTASPTCRARANRVMFSSCTASMLQPQMLSCGWFCSSVFHAWRSWLEGYEKKVPGAGCHGAACDGAACDGAACDGAACDGAACDGAACDGAAC